MYIPDELNKVIISYLQSNEAMLFLLSSKTNLMKSQLFFQEKLDDCDLNRLENRINKSDNIRTRYTNIHHQIKSKTPVCSISVGHRHTMICSDGIVFAKGCNSDYQLGLESTQYQRQFCRVKTISKVKSCSAGLWHTLFLLENQAVLVAGKNKYNQLALMDPSKRQKTDISYKYLLQKRSSLSKFLNISLF